MITNSFSKFNNVIVLYMKKIILILLLFKFLFAQNIACVGNSITDSGYPDIIDTWMEENGFDYDVHNFGVPGASVMLNAYKTTFEYQKLLTMKPQHIILMLGSNDWGVYAGGSSEWRNEWEVEYRYLVDNFKKKSNIFLGTITFRIDSSDANIPISSMNERIKKVADEFGLEIIDFNAILGTDPVNFLPDGVHPSNEGKIKLARLAYDVLIKYPVNSPETLPASNNFFGNYFEEDKCIQLVWDEIDKAQSYRLNRSYKIPENNQWIHSWYNDICDLEYIDFDLLSNITYFYTVQGFLNGIYGDRSIVLMITTGTLGCFNKILIINNLKLDQNYPNPFNPSTNIKYTLPNKSQVKIVIYDIMGNKIKTIVDEYKQAGQYIVNWNGTDAIGQFVNSGMYIYKLHVGGLIQKRKMVLLK